ncbi:MAG: cysteine--tRNA ligase [bacterium]|nr:cysteine--tRNA ligase [bacterium]
MLTIFNSLSRKLEPFKPQNPPAVTMYTCGPTVYNFVHIGNLRAYVFYDTLKRLLRSHEYAIKHVMNITDVDDKIIRGSAAEIPNCGLRPAPSERKNQDPNERIKSFSKKYEEAYFEDLKKLNIISADVNPKATEYIPQMVTLIQTLLHKGVAYKSEDGSIYFSIKKFPQYGRLSRLDKKSLRPTERMIKDEYTKDSIQDFALWKAAKEGEPSWETPFGKGRPGWHIECSAMANDLLGETIDIHSGGVDLIFPHHENEIAQSEAATGKPFARYWIHNEHLLVDNQKMSKSLHNFYTLREIEEKGIDPLALRYLFLTVHYRDKLNFTWESLEAARQALTRLRDLVATWDEPAIGCAGYEADFLAAIADDLGTPRGLALLWDLVHDREYPTSARHASILKMDKVLGLRLDSRDEITLSSEEKKLLDDRQQARRVGDFEVSDEIRATLENKGLVIEDTANNGFRLKRKRTER